MIPLNIHRIVLPAGPCGTQCPLAAPAQTHTTINHCDNPQTTIISLSSRSLWDPMSTCSACKVTHNNQSLTIYKDQYQLVQQVLVGPNVRLQCLQNHAQQSLTVTIHKHQYLNTYHKWGYVITDVIIMDFPICLLITHYSFLLQLVVVSCSITDDVVEHWCVRIYNAPSLH
jgi:hypothetical protein